MNLGNHDRLRQALKTDASILGIALFVLLPLSYVHGLFFVIFTLSLIYLVGSGFIYAITIYRKDGDDGSS